MQSEHIYCTRYFICFLNNYIFLNYVNGSIVLGNQQLSVHFSNGVNKIVRKTIDRCIINKLIAIVPAQAIKGTNPYKAFTVLVNAANRICDHPVLNCVFNKVSLLRKCDMK